VPNQKAINSGGSGRVRREVLYPALQRVGIKRELRASGFHAFRRAMGKAVRKEAGLEMASIQLSHKNMTRTDEHYNDRDRDDLIAAAKMAEQVLAVCPQKRVCPQEI
jgi:hypothetical protein